MSSENENQRGRLNTLEIIRERSAQYDLRNHSQTIQAPLTVICLHGFGADNADLFPLAQYLDPKSQWDWIFPNAPLEVPIGGGFMGRAWFPVDLEDLNRRMSSGVPRDQGLENPKGLVQARNAIDEMLKNIETPRSNIVMAGFSQGAMMAIDTVLRSEEQMKGLVIFSGALVNETEWTSWAPRHGGLPFFQSHGQSDPLLSYDGAKRLNKTLKSGGLRGELQGFPGGHEIPPPTIMGAAKFLLRLAMAAPSEESP